MHFLNFPTKSSSSLSSLLAASNIGQKESERDVISAIYRPLILASVHRVTARHLSADRPGLSSLCLRQVTIEYANQNGAMIPLNVHSVVVSVQHAPEIPIEDMRREIMQKVSADTDVIHSCYLCAGRNIYVPR